MCGDLGINFLDENIDKCESTKGSTYSIRLEGKHTLDFLLGTFVEENKLQKVNVQVKIGYDKGSAPFYADIDIVEHINKDNYLTRWVTQTMHSFNLKYNPVNMDALFGTTEVRVYGTYSNPILALKEMEILLNGMRYAEMNKPIVYKFRHVDDYLMRRYSYCFFVSDDRGTNFWAFFHDMGGLDSGGHSIAFEMVEAMIEANATVDLRQTDIEYDRLYKFLSEHVTTFSYVDKNELCFDLGYGWSGFGATFFESYSKFLERYHDGEYSQVLRDLRALLQAAMGVVCKKKGIAVPSNPDINKLCSLLVKNKVLDGKTTVWYCAFSSIANLAAHGEFPTKDDLLDESVKNRAKITILLGTQLISELDDAINWVEDSNGAYHGSVDDVL